MSTSHPPAYRYTAAAYWWIASEIARRHPRLELVESYVQDGFYDMLTLRGNISQNEIRIDFNRLGSIHVHPEHIGLMNAGQVMLDDDPHRAVKRIEEAAGLVVGAKAPASTARIVTLRLMARFLNFVVNDRFAWDLRMITANGHGPSLELFPSEGAPPTETAFPQVFPTLKDFHSFLVSAELTSHVDPGRLWGLQRDGEVVAIFDTRGVLFTPGNKTEIKTLYDQLGRNLAQTMVAAMGRFLA